MSVITDREKDYRRYRRAMDVSADLSGVVGGLTYWGAMLGNANTSIDNAGRLPGGFGPLCFNAADALDAAAKTLRLIARG